MNTPKGSFEYIAVACIFIGTCLLAGCQKSDVPQNPLSGRDLVVYGKIFTADQSESIVEAFVIKDGKFVYVGTETGVSEYITPNMKVIDYRGKGLVIPGCTEGHGHFIGTRKTKGNLPGHRRKHLV